MDPSSYVIEHGVDLSVRNCPGAILVEDHRTERFTGACVALCCLPQRSDARTERLLGSARACAAPVVLVEPVLRRICSAADSHVPCLLVFQEKSGGVDGDHPAGSTLSVVAAEQEGHGKLTAGAHDQRKKLCCNVLEHETVLFDTHHATGQTLLRGNRNLKETRAFEARPRGAGNTHNAVFD